MDQEPGITYDGSTVDCRRISQIIRDMAKVKSDEIASTIVKYRMVMIIPSIIRDNVSEALRQCAGVHTVKCDPKFSTVTVSFKVVNEQVDMKPMLDTIQILADAETVEPELTTNEEPDVVHNQVVFKYASSDIDLQISSKD
jgi:hypothetical protein